MSETTKRAGGAINHAGSPNGKRSYNASDREQMINAGALAVTNPKALVAGLLFCLSAGPAAYAQTTVDVSKITCEQFLLYKITDPNNIAIWLSGYYNGKRDNTVIDVQGLQDHLSKVKDYCRSNYTKTVMQAVETVVGAPK
jgi:acid stress chaperone HdeB